MGEQKSNFPTATQAEPAQAEDARTPRSPSGRVLLTELAEARRAAVAAVLQEERYDVCNCANAEAVMRRAKVVTPDVVILDAELPHGQPEQCLRTLKRCYQTSSVSIILACPRTFDRHRLMAMVQEGAATILPKPYTRQQVVDTVRAAVERSRTVRADMAIEHGAHAAPSMRVDSNNAPLVRPIHCVLHSDRPQLNRYLLRPGVAAVETDFFGLPTFKPTGAGHDPVDFNILSVLVCPHCLFASAHVGYFLDPAERKERRHHFDAPTLRALEEDRCGRKELFAQPSADFFTEKRTDDDARIAFDLALRCSGILHEQNPHTLPTELLRLANYRLMLARLCEPTDEAAARRTRMEAIDPLKKVITTIDGAGRAKAAYQLVALGVHVEDLQMAASYLTLLADSEAEAAASVKEQIQPYLQRAREIMEKTKAASTPAA